MTKLSPAEIAQYAHQAGFRGDGLVNAVAVALAESGGRNDAHNGVAPDNSYGLWQINMIGAMGPERREQFGIDHNAALFRPAENAAAAYAISNHGKDFGPWTTYGSGAYKQYLDEARRAAGKAGRLHGMHKHASKGDGRHGPGGGFTADIGALHTFTRRTAELAEDLRTIARTRLSHVRTNGHAFGAVGRESGFDDALDSFGAAVHYQTNAMGYNASTFSQRTKQVADAYTDLEQRARGAFDGAGKHGGKH